VTFAWIEERRDQWPITLLCRVLGVSRSGYYAWLARKPSAAEVRREELTEEVKEIHAEVKGRYGSPRVHAELVDRGHECSVNFVAQVMREAGIAAKTKRKFRQTTDSNHTLPVAENILDRDFNPEEPNTSWVADVTYIPTREGWLYLAAVEDLFSRRVVGWSMDATMTSRGWWWTHWRWRWPVASRALRLRAWWRTRIAGASTPASTTSVGSRRKGSSAA